MAFSRVRAVATLLAGALVVATPAASAVETASDARPERSLQLALDRVVDAGATGAVARVDDRHRRIAVASGVAERGTKTPVPLHAKFRAGSVTKALIGTLVLRLVERDRLALDDTVGERLPGLVPAARHVTVRELLSHTSGITDVMTTFPRPGTAEFVQLRTKRWTPDQLMQRIAQMPLESAPGSTASYSNTNYLLLASMIERVTGRSYQETISRQILRPVGMAESYFPKRAGLLRPHARGYVPVERPDGTSTLVDITRFEPSIMWGGGELVSTTRDLNRFFGALVRGRLLPPHLMREMRTPALDSKYGLGIIRERLSCGLVVWGKDGDAPGFSTWSFASPHGGTRVTVSVTWGEGDPDEAVRRVLDVALCGPGS